MKKSSTLVKIDRRIRILTYFYGHSLLFVFFLGKFFCFLGKVVVRPFDDVYYGKRISKEALSFLLSSELAPSTAWLGNIGKASVCHKERRERKGR
jgi:hypothetical protein